ncbi:hypothetical protein BSAF29S_01743 [Bacillus safensis subsp. safensis]
MILLPETTASLETDDLRKLQFSQRKAEYVIDVSKRIVSGSLCLEELHDLSDLEVEERLLPIRGDAPLDGSKCAHEWAWKTKSFSGGRYRHSKCNQTALRPA